MASTATTTGHDLRIEREVIRRGSDPQGWAVNEPGLNARATCTCGLDTGWVPRADAAAVYCQHINDSNADLPDSIPHGKLKQVCDLLGLPAHRVRSVTTDAQQRRVTVTVYVLTAHGAKIVNGTGDDTGMREVHIPLADG